MNTLQVIHVLAGIVVLAEALNKLERCDPLKAVLSSTARIVEVLKAIAWLLLAVGAGGAIAAPALLALGVAKEAMGVLSNLIRLERPQLGEVCALAGFAVLIIRTRIKEG